MISFKIGKTNLTLCFSFLAVVTLCVLLYGERIILLSVISCLLHECGHIIAMKAFGVSIREVRLYGGGMKITCAPKLLTFSKELSIALSGAALNFLICILSAFYFKTLSVINLTLGTFNLLPIGYLDGGRATDLILERFPKMSVPLILLKVMAALLLSLLIAYAVLRGWINLSVFVTAAFLAVSEALIYTKKAA